MIASYWSPVVNHLWQSTIFAGLAALLALMLRKNHAQLRYRLWLAASLKFLIPFSLLVNAGQQFEWRTAPSIAPPLSAAVAQFSQPFTPSPAVLTDPLPAATTAWPVEAALLIGFWFCGSAAILARWFLRWRRIRSDLRMALPLEIQAPVPVMASPALMEPGVFGVFRPVLLVPAGIWNRLSDEQFQAILAHELCHVRRRDNLAAAIHMVVESTFWFHPLVWWIGSRMVRERERACDEEALRLGNKPEVYAEGILSVCRHYLESPLACNAGVTGADLKRRIEQILDGRLSKHLTLTRKIIVTAAGIAVVALPLLIGVVGAPHGRAQSKPGEPAFEVASVKPGDQNARGIRMMITPGGGVGFENVSVRQVITLAYDIQNYQLTGGPSWVDTAKFTIVAKGPSEPGESTERLPNKAEADLARARVRTLLADRFQLQVRHDFKDAAVYVLGVAKKGLRMKEADPHGGLTARRPGELIGEGAPLASLVRMLGVVLSRPVIDQTGLKGTYDFMLEWTPDMGSSGTAKPGTPIALKAEEAGVNLPDSTGSSIFNAIQEQLGLQLESKKAPVETIVIERVERPAGN